MTSLPSAPRWLPDRRDRELWRLLASELAPEPVHPSPLEGTRPCADGTPAAGTPLVERAALHGVLFLLERSATAGRLRLDDDARSLLDRRRAEERLWSRALEGRLVELLGLLDARGLPTVVLKGLPLGERLWRDRLLRPTTDLDLLVEPDRLAEAAAAARGSGWVPLPGSVRDGDDSHHLRFLRDGAVVLELHSRLTAGGHSVGSLVGRSIPWSGSGGFSCRILAPVDEAVHLAAHAALHGLGRLGWLVDVARLAEVAPAGTFDAGPLAATARELGLSTAAAVGLAAAFDLAGLSPPLPVPFAGGLALRAMAMSNDPRRPRRLRAGAHLAIRALLFDRSTDGARFLLRSLGNLAGRGEAHDEAVASPTVGASGSKGSDAAILPSLGMALDSDRSADAAGIAPPDASLPLVRFPSGAVLSLELAIAPEALARGLSGRGSLAEGTAMLFVLSSAQQRPLHLDGCRFPLDVLFVDAERRVVARHDALAPPPPGLPSARITPPSPVLFVLEATAPCAAIRSAAVGDRIDFEDLPLELLPEAARRALGS